MKKYETYLPVFPGFYGTFFEPSEESEIEYINQTRKENGLEPITDYSIEFDNAQYELDMCESCCSVMDGFLGGLKLVSKITMQNISSPKEYNFHNDSINVVIEMDAKNRKAIQTYIYAHRKEFEEYLKETYTSCDGFWSSYSNLFTEWEAETGNFYRFDDPAHYLGSVLEFICQQENITSETLYEFTEAYLGCEDYEFETTKIQCPVCKDWYVADKDQKWQYNNQIEFDKQNYGKEFEPIPYESWLKKQPVYEHCPENEK